MTQFNGTKKADVIEAGEGDVVFGNGGNDTISGITFQANGGDGNDVIKGYSSFNILIGGSGNDTIGSYYGDGNNISGGDGNDTLYSDGDRTTISGGSGNDRIELTHIGERIVPGGLTIIADGGSGNDIIEVATMNSMVSVSGGDGNDVIDLSRDRDSFVSARGGKGNDVFHGGDSSEDLWGDSGKDVFYLSTGTDNLTGGAGADIFSFAELLHAGDGKTTILDFSKGDKVDVSALGQFLTLGSRGVTLNDLNLSEGSLGDTIHFDYLTNSTPTTFELVFAGNHNITASDFIGLEPIFTHM